MTERRTTGILREDQYIFFIISRSVLLRMRNVSDKSCRENQNTHFVFNNFFSRIVPFMRSYPSMTLQPLPGLGLAHKTPPFIPICSFTPPSSYPQQLSSIPLNHIVYEITWKNILDPRRATVDNMAHAHCMLGNEGYKYTHSEYVTFIAFPLQQC